MSTAGEWSIQVLRTNARYSVDTVGCVCARYSVSTAGGWSIHCLGGVNSVSTWVCVLDTVSTLFGWCQRCVDSDSREMKYTGVTNVGMGVWC